MSCADPGPVQFDGSYEIDRLAVGDDYMIYAEPLDRVVLPAHVTGDRFPLPQRHHRRGMAAAPGMRRSTSGHRIHRSNAPGIKEGGLRSQAASQVPPNSKPGPSEAIKIGRGRPSEHVGAICRAA
jgi:hypothetical protein